MNQSIMELVREAENQAKQLKEAAETQRRERILEAEKEAVKLREDHQVAMRKRIAEHLAKQNQQAQAEAEDTIMQGRNAAAQLESAARQRLGEAVEVVLRKVL